MQPDTPVSVPAALAGIRERNEQLRHRYGYVGGHRDGWDDGNADRDPDPGRLAYGASKLNDYELGYVASGLRPDEPPLREGDPRGR